MTELFSTITSPAFSELIIVLTEHSYFPQNTAFFNALRTMNEARPFKLVFSLEVWDSPYREMRWWLIEAVELAITEGTFDFLDSPPVVRIAQSRHYEFGGLFDDNY